MDWTSPGDLHKRFKLFKQKCNLIFDGPLEDTDEAKKVKLLLLWIGDKGLEIYNAASWDNAAHKDQLKPVFTKLEEYTKPQSNQILARFQLRSLKQGNMTLEEFVTKARLLIDDGGYAEATKDETLRDTLVFGLASDKVRKDAIALGNDLTLKQVYDLAKVEESTRTQMDIISPTGREDNSSIHAVRSKKSSHTKTFPAQNQQTRQKQRPIQYSSANHQQTQQSKFRGCMRCGGKHAKTDACPAKNAQCNFCRKIGHFMKVCLKRNSKVHEMSETPTDAHDAWEDDSQCSKDSLFMDSITSIDNIQHAPVQSAQLTKNFANRIYAKVRLNNSSPMNLKVDTGADTCVLTTDDIQLLPELPNIRTCHKQRRGYRRNKIPDVGTVSITVTFSRQNC